MIISFGKKKIGKSCPVFIIAEIGVNHEGSIDVCLEMVEEAARSGADAIKLQTVDPDENYVKGHPSWELFRTCQLTKAETETAFRLAEDLGMEAFTTAPDPATLSWVDDLGVPGHKISSGMMTNDIILRKTCALGKPVLISTGMANLHQIDHAVKVAKESGNKNIALFQCTSEYPAPPESLNLSSIKWLEDRYNLPIGFSDHSEGIEAAIAAVTLGAVMIEKHFTLDKSRAGYDHGISLEPLEFSTMAKGIRNAEKAENIGLIQKNIPGFEAMLGRPERVLPTALEQKAAGNLRCLVARKKIHKDEIFTEENVGLKRPFADKRGLEPQHYDSVLGRVAKTELEKDDPIVWEKIV